MIFSYLRIAKRQSVTRLVVWLILAIKAELIYMPIAGYSTEEIQTSILQPSGESNQSAFSRKPYLD